MDITQDSRSSCNIDDIRQEIIQNWNIEKVPYRNACVHKLIEEQVTRTPEVTAVEFQGRDLTYQNLNISANVIAHKLSAMGIKKNEMVGLCMDRSIEMIVAVVAIFKAGGCVVPLDASYPNERLSFMVSDSGLNKVITTKKLCAEFPETESIFIKCQKIYLDESHADGQNDNPDLQTSSEGLAYCIYTSGSTGVPKGVIIEHKALANLVAWHRDEWLAEVGTRTLLFSPISFDVSFHEIIAGLCTGATLVQIDEETRRNPIALASFVYHQNIEKWYMPFVTLQQISLAAKTVGYPKNLKELIVGGEPLRITDEIREFARQTRCVIQNNYGSTECLTITTYSLQGDPEKWPALAPIGKPTIYNTNVYILDENMKPVNIGEVGEIYADGDCLAKEYHNRQDLTKERFIENPYDIQGKRLYRTKDLGRYLPDGNIECIGRSDNQVKIRGYRVEIGEIETALASHEFVAECVVSVKKNSMGTNKIYAHIVSVPDQDDHNLEDSLRTYLSSRIPDYMIPSRFIFLKELPLTPSGKVDLRNLPAPEVTMPINSQSVGRSIYDIEQILVNLWKEILERHDIDHEKTFFEQGGDSLLIVRVHQQISDILECNLSPTVLFKYPTIVTLAQYLFSIIGDTSITKKQEKYEGIKINEEIAIIGMSCRVPGANTPESFWLNLKNGVESIQNLNDEEIFHINDEVAGDPNFVKVAAMLPDIDLFDADFFGYSPAEAEMIDPQQRLFLEVAWEALENAGINSHSYNGEIGVYAGSSISTYLVNNVLPTKSKSKVFLSHRHFNEPTELRIEQGNASDHLPTRASYKLNLRGPSVNVQTTCSTSLVAVHMACRALLNKECNVALAGAVSIITPQNTGYTWGDGMMLSQDGHCHAFDEEATGTVFGNGLGIVVLKPLSEAIKDGDNIYAVIKGSAVNNDGSMKMDYAGPNPQAQTDVIVKAHKAANITADAISYVETHGTGTILGDPIEIAALDEAFKRTQKYNEKYCAIGSVKTNIGHLDEAAGIVGLIKTVLAIRNRQLPPSLNFQSPNRHIDFKSTPFHVQTTLTDWVPRQGRRIAGVSSFGMGGTNCHVVLEEPPENIIPLASNKIDRKTHILTISGKTPEALKENIKKYAAYLDESNHMDFVDICYSASTRRKHFDYRMAVLADSKDTAHKKLSNLLSDENFDSKILVAKAYRKKIAFMFAGQGSQYHQMGKDLYETQPIFRSTIEECDKILLPYIGQSIVSLLYAEIAEEKIHDTALSQPVIFSLEYALFKLWDSWGIKPDVMIGHSLGEYVAACVAGVFSLEDALKLVSVRGRLMQNLKQDGSMLQIHAPVRDVENVLSEYSSDDVSIAAINAPEIIVISGRSEIIQRVYDHYKDKSVNAILLNVSHAFHSPLMVPILQEFRNIAQQITYNFPTIPFISNITGESCNNNIATAEYWLNHITSPVRFYEGISKIKSMNINVFLELSPKPTLSNFIPLCIKNEDISCFSSISPRASEVALESLRSLYLLGFGVDWNSFEKPFNRKYTPLPTYAFQGKRYWLEAKNEQRERCYLSGAENTSMYKLEKMHFFPPVQANVEKNRYIVIHNSDRRSLDIIRVLRAHGNICIEFPESSLNSIGNLSLSRELNRYREDSNMHILFIGGVDCPSDVSQRAMDYISSVRSVVEEVTNTPQVNNIWFVMNNIDGNELASLSQSCISGCLRSINIEHSDLNFLYIDFPTNPEEEDYDALSNLAESINLILEERLSIHKGKIYVPRLIPIEDDPSRKYNESTLPIKAHGTYLITGGTGGIGLRLALQIVTQSPERLILLSKSGKISESDQKIWKQIEEFDTQVDIVKVDVADEQQMQQFFSSNLSENLEGIFHCAGYIDDGIFLNQTDEAIKQVLSPKVHGAWILHNLTINKSLDFFVMFSSTASLIGYGGQSIYAGANSFLDSLACYRVANNLPALSLNWGSWKGAGMTGRMNSSEKEAIFRSGETLLDAQDAFGMMSFLLQSNIQQAAIVSMDWKEFIRSRSRFPTIISNIITEQKTDINEDRKTNFREILKVANPQEAKDILRSLVIQEIRSILGDHANNTFDSKTGFTQMGIDSLGAINLRSKLQTLLSCKLPVTLAFDYPCLEDLVTYLEEDHFKEEINYIDTSYRTDDNKSADDLLFTSDLAIEGHNIEAMVAVIGMGCELPGAGTPEELWTLLNEGLDTTRVVPDNRWNIQDVYDPNPDAPGKMYIKQAAFIDKVDCFDYGFFGISPHEAMYMDPRQRLLLEVSWEAIERAGIDPSSLRGTDMGVYLGGDEFINDYLTEISKVGLESDPYVVTGNALGFSAGRLSYKYGLHGPSMTIATACSSSLVALHSAVQAIVQRDCSTAIVGSAKLMLRPEETIQLCKLKALAPDGRSKAFSADADGYGRGEGCGVVVLKRLDQALVDKNPILAVIRATAVNHDGPSAGLTVPNRKSQANLIKKALKKANVDPADIVYVEAHGTGTQLGDPIEIMALNDVFNVKREKPLLVGSVKANIGHLEEAAGIAGLIKLVLCLQRRIVPRQIHATILNRNIPWQDLPINIPNENIQLNGNKPIVAGLSSFGMSGTNVHAILESFPIQMQGRSFGLSQYIFVFSARDKEDLDALITRYINFENSGVNPCDVAYTLHIGRKQERIRMAVLADGIVSLQKHLTDHINGRADSLHVFYGEVDTTIDKYTLQLSDEDINTRTRILVSSEDWAALALSWCNGNKVNWEIIYERVNPSRIVLPTYPFKEKSIWIENRYDKKTSQPILCEPQSNKVDKIKKEHLYQLGNLNEVLREYIANILGLTSADIHNDSSFYELGADSLTFIRVSQFLKDEFKLSTSFQQLFEEGTTINKLVELISMMIAGDHVDKDGTEVSAITQKTKPTNFVVSKVVKSDEKLTVHQSNFLRNFEKVYSVRTHNSKNQAQMERPIIANCRMAPFRSHIKEVSYPIVGKRSAGSRMWDVDNNEYVDISMGYGVHLFGHQPDFIINSLKKQLDLGMQIGPLSEKAGKVAQLLCEITGMDRVAFCNSGTESVMAALRFARAATGRTKFIMFEGSYHGWSDGTLGLPAGINSSLPMARGIGPGSMEDVVVLEYGTDESFEIVKSLGSQLAAILVEPVQSRRPDIRPKEFLQKIREFTKSNGIALIFDEVITGFRVHPGGAQAWYGIEADLVTYGKVLGGGMPIGAVAGRSRFLDTVDGGTWSYGDESTPLVPTTFYGGTFNKNPLSMAAAEAVLVYLKEQGPELQENLSHRVAMMAQRLNDYFENGNFPIRIIYFSSWFRFIAVGEYSLQRFPLDVDLFFYMMVHKGVYILETRVSFLSTSHTDEDIEFIIQASKESVEELREGGFMTHAEPNSMPLPDNLLKDIYLNLNTQELEKKTPFNINNVLLTGATGFLGAYLLRDLLLLTSANIYCLVRAENKSAALKRVKENLQEYGCWQVDFEKRIIPVIGDLALPNLGLEHSVWEELSQTVDIIYHNGAHVNSLLPYEKLRAANVEGTRNLLKLASEVKIKSFHYVSSDAVFESYGANSKETLYEDEPLGHGDSIYGGGYSESKWVAEKIVEIAQEKGIPVSIYRPSMITGDSIHGVGQSGDFFTRFITGGLQSGFFPELDAVIDFTPVDWVSRMIIEISQRETPGKTYHLSHENPISYKQFIEGIKKSGFIVECVSYPDWKAMLSNIRYEHGNALYPLLPILLETSDPIFRKAKMDVKNVQRSRENLPSFCPDIISLIQLYLKHSVSPHMIDKSNLEIKNEC